MSPCTAGATIFPASLIYLLPEASAQDRGGASPPSTIGTIFYRTTVPLAPGLPFYPRGIRGLCTAVVPAKGDLCTTVIPAKAGIQMGGDAGWKV